MAIVMLLWSPFLAKIKFCRRTPEILVHVPTAELLFLETHTKNQFGKQPEGLRHFRDHRWKALGEGNPGLSGPFLFRHYFESYTA